MIQAITFLLSSSNRNPQQPIQQPCGNLRTSKIIAIISPVSSGKHTHNELERSTMLSMGKSTIKSINPPTPAICRGSAPEKKLLQDSGRFPRAFLVASESNVSASLPLYSSPWGTLVESQAYKMEGTQVSFLQTTLLSKLPKSLL